ncbi:DUF1080 domain-containing protein [Mucilaginibacter sp. JRF]|uniref:3-keto-disaccharide hydrolase n=1 Tax=Mucilaginibacter sp. JRF TaxID=2780088 RepID=UPI001882E7C2|nr:DUF1080 domain-containing protein [Mucilaginibacter sp. JRF]MBE9583716.1 DUF1080 domain-containing protein [Mucilaginibacter sp. JRF]
MKRPYYLVAPLLILLFTSFINNDEWVPLLDAKLSKWETYLSYRHKNGYKGAMPLDEKGKPIKPIGYNNDKTGVFTITKLNNETLLHVSGEIYGCLYTKQSFKNYHLKLMVKWGDKKWVPRLNEPKDSGIIYHSNGTAGIDYWRSWMLGQEMQVMEGGCGDYWCIASSAGYITAKKTPAKKDTMVYDPAGIKTFMGAGNNFVQQSHNYEKPNNGWNTLELICFGDKSLHILNGHVVMALSGSSYKDGNVYKPLTSGKLQIQSEAAEVYYKSIYIKPIQSLPAEYLSYFK